MNFEMIGTVTGIVSALCGVAAITFGNRKGRGTQAGGSGPIAPKNNAELNQLEREFKLALSLPLEHGRDERLCEVAKKAHIGEFFELEDRILVRITDTAMKAKLIQEFLN